MISLRCNIIYGCVHIFIFDRFVGYSSSKKYNGKWSKDINRRWNCFQNIILMTTENCFLYYTFWVFLSSSSTFSDNRNGRIEKFIREKKIVKKFIILLIVVERINKFKRRFLSQNGTKSNKKKEMSMPFCAYKINNKVRDKLKWNAKEKKKKKQANIISSWIFN